MSVFPADKPISLTCAGQPFDDKELLSNDSLVTFINATMLSLGICMPSRSNVRRSNRTMGHTRTRLGWYSPVVPTLCDHLFYFLHPPAGFLPSIRWKNVGLPCSQYLRRNSRGTQMADSLPVFVAFNLRCSASDRIDARLPDSS